MSSNRRSKNRPAGAGHSFPPPQRRPDRKSLQLARQVQRTLSYVLGSVTDPVVSELYVESVEPAPDSSRLLVTVVSLGEKHETADVLTRLHTALGYIRSEVAASINRRKVPELVFKYSEPTPPPDPTAEAASEPSE